MADSEAIDAALRRPVQGDRHDEDTLRKVYDALTAEGYETTEVTDMVNAMQNAGILFRERRPDATGA